MKKISLILCVMLIAILFAISCHRYPVTNCYYSNSYIAQYSNIKLFLSKCGISEGENARIIRRDYYNFGDTIVMKCSYFEDIPYEQFLKGLLSSYTPEMFDSLDRVHGDTAYNNYVHCDNPCYMTNGLYHFDNNAPIADICSVNLKSDHDWDESHPAGSSLNDLIVYFGNTLMPYIRSGYDDSVSEAVQIEKPLAEMTAEDFMLNIYNEPYHNSFKLVFTSLPTIDFYHTITIDIKMSDGSVYSDSFVIKQ